MSSWGKLKNNICCSEHSTPCVQSSFPIFLLQRVTIWQLGLFAQRTCSLSVEKVCSLFDMELTRTQSTANANAQGFTMWLFSLNVVVRFNLHHGAFMFCNYSTDVCGCYKYACVSVCFSAWWCMNETCLVTASCVCLCPCLWVWAHVSGGIFSTTSHCNAMALICTPLSRPLHPPHSPHQPPCPQRLPVRHSIHSHWKEAANSLP